MKITAPDQRGVTTMAIARQLIIRLAIGLAAVYFCYKTCSSGKIFVTIGFAVISTVSFTLALLKWFEYKNRVRNCHRRTLKLLLRLSTTLACVSLASAAELGILNKKPFAAAAVCAAVAFGLHSVNLYEQYKSRMPSDQER